ncbi:hypothetical protein BDW02DRAFT_117305 [Decorospora gaudefroyi]|uniref:Uncharacterized protein n=1 Tax=Decorospora gaudefroyi TaxID=184978 RepID=A0A6A5K1D9_9PLEO|nr:hypothetical protein BDW02DRAFT_117305 [Decorospora gaudefroyi]
MPKTCSHLALQVATPRTATLSARHVCWCPATCSCVIFHIGSRSDRKLRAIVRRPTGDWKRRVGNKTKRTPSPHQAQCAETIHFPLLDSAISTEDTGNCIRHELGVMATAQQTSFPRLHPGCHA